jgi:hypothetical protein
MNKKFPVALTFLVGILATVVGVRQDAHLCLWVGGVATGVTLIMGIVDHLGWGPERPVEVVHLPPKEQIH